MTIVPHISSIYANPWGAWVLFALLFLLVINPSPQLNVLMGLRSVFSHSERVYSIHARAWGSEICSHVFRMGVVAMAVLILVGHCYEVMFLSFVKVFVVVAIVYALQRLLLHGIGRVFISPKQLDAAIEQYNGICTMVCVCLFPIVVLMMNVPAYRLAQILCGTILVLFVVLLFWKSVRLFYVKILSILYILLYIIYLEIIPLAVIFSLVKHIV